MPDTCTHIDALDEIKTAQQRLCEECVKIGARWVHLRTCQTCGVTLCCDSSPNRHASRHAAQEDHPVLRSVEPGEEWSWCVIDEVAFVLKRG
jgi:Zn-finger in ubiquitin-hydrolases and other protein